MNMLKMLLVVVSLFTFASCAQLGFGDKKACCKKDKKACELKKDCKDKKACDLKKKEGHACCIKAKKEGKKCSSCSLKKDVHTSHACCIKAKKAGKSCELCTSKKVTSKCKDKNCDLKHKS